MTRRPPAPRDQHASPFTAVLERLCASTAALGAALVDGEGETVDYAGSLEPFDIRVTAAEWTVVLSLARQAPSSAISGAHLVMARGTLRSFAVVGLDEGYAIVLALPRRCFGASPRALAAVVQDLSEEAGLRVPARKPGEDRWYLAYVQGHASDRRRPARLQAGEGWEELAVLGRLGGGLGPGEQAYRVRLHGGRELTLLRERGGLWFADEDPRS